MKRINNQTYIPLTDLEVYQIARQLSVVVWEIYKRLDWLDKKTIKFQSISLCK